MTDRIPHGSGAKGPDELRQQIERTRHELGDTVAELVGRTDVKGRALARAADLRDKAGAMTVQLRTSAAQAGHAVQHKVARTGHAVQDRAGHVGRAARDTVPEPLRDVLRTGPRRPGPFVAAGVLGPAAAAAGFVWGRRRRCA
ncbi:DUF3618 domain-containing protein [Streptomyces sp. TG1A-8]|uniref:DUF3618 domain-containing protein n=1 Tax=Streptomyces sp. TG1A-8 TaxID=3051385 RepID=UPI00265BE092|nr:DUF3618 domain-containing protein [Streptomyces sp. TG1A-8]MDO0928280.1 DUF3618 domain-containing protein [Streptomyces sp. TG1A-8]